MKKYSIRKMFAGILAVCMLSGTVVYAEENPYAEMEPAELMTAYHDANQYGEDLQEKYVVCNICFELDGAKKYVIMGPNEYCYYSFTDADGSTNDEVSLDQAVTYGWRLDVDGREMYRIKIYDERLWEYERNIQLTYAPLDISIEESEIVNIQDVDGATTFTFITPIDDEGKAYLEELGMTVEEIESIQTLEEAIVTEKGSLRMVSSQKYAVFADRKVLYVTSTYEYPETIDNTKREEELEALVYDGEETHTFMLKVSPGTEDEDLYTLTANTNAVIDYWVLDADNSYDVYTDEACTIPYEGFVGEGYIPFTEDLTLYMK